MLLTVFFVGIALYLLGRMLRARKAISLADAIGIVGLCGGLAFVLGLTVPRFGEMTMFGIPAFMVGLFVMVAAGGIAIFTKIGRD